VATGAALTWDMGEDLKSRRFERILLVKPSSLGDIVHALPVLHGLRTRYPEAHISWLVFATFAPLIEHHPELNEVIPLDRRRFRGRGCRTSKALTLAGFVRELRSRRFDLVVDLQGLFRSGIMSLATGCPTRIGFAHAREMAWMFYTHHIRADDVDTHAAERNYLLAHLLGFADVPLVFDLAVTDQERRAASDVLREAGLADDDPFIAVFPGARWETKRWPVARIAAVMDRLWGENGLRSVLLGAPDERAVCDEVDRQSRSKPVNLAGKTGVRDLVAVIERASVVLAHDSAPMHVAAALNRPLVAILGPTNPRRTGPYGMSESVVQANLPCAPCYLKRLAQCPYHHACMRSIEPERIVDRIGLCLSGVLR